MIDPKIKTYKSLAELFRNNGFLLYMVGGTVRDYLLEKELTDMDLVTNATPSEMKIFLTSADYTFEKYGSVRLVFEGVKFDITTLRKECGYSDYRHPNEIIFTNKIEEDVLRRDITINALYMDESLKVIDLVGGVNDLKKCLIKMVGDPSIRIKEDPLRILRIYRFKVETGFSFDKNLNNSIKENKDLVNKLNKDKIKQEINKCSDVSLLESLLKKDGIFVDTNNK